MCWISYIMLHSTNLVPSCYIHFIKCFQVFSEVNSWLYLIAHSPLDFLLLLNQLSRLSQLNLQANSEVSILVYYQVGCQLHSKVYTQPTCLYTSNYTVSMLPNMLSNAWDGTLQPYLTLCSPVHSHEVRYSQSHLPIAPIDVHQ